MIWEEYSVFITRTISGIVLLIIIIGAILTGGYVWLALAGILSLIALYELFGALGIRKSAMEWSAYIVCAAAYVIFNLGLIGMVYVMPVLYFIIIMAVYVIKWPKYDVNVIAKSFFAFFYAVVCMVYLYQIRVDSIYYIWLVFISAWGSDTCAYVTGILIGKHKMPGTLSPKKTIEGCIGGVLGAAIIGFIYGMIISGTKAAFICAVICMIGSFVSQTGDLAASAVKRNCGIKDYGKLIPGHGGVMDRFDSLLFVAPVIYCILYCAFLFGLNIHFV